MGKKERLRAGEKIELYMDEKYRERYYSRVEEVVDNNVFVIASPIGGKKYTYLSLGQVIKVVYFREDGLYCFDAKVIDRMKSGSAISAKVSALAESYKIQRRDYYRLEIMVPVTMNWRQEGKSFSKVFDTVDMSGGGIRIVSQSEIKMETNVNINIKIPELESEDIKGRVVRCERSLKNNRLFEIGIEFTELSNANRQRILYYLFSRERQMLKVRL